MRVAFNGRSLDLGAIVITNRSIGDAVATVLELAKP
jgi:hypothetical protein